MFENVKIRPFGQRKGTEMSEKYAHEVKKHVIWIIRSFFMLAFVSIRLVVEKLGKGWKNRNRIFCEGDICKSSGAYHHLM